MIFHNANIDFGGATLRRSKRSPPAVLRDRPGREAHAHVVRLHAALLREVLLQRPLRPGKSAAEASFISGSTVQPGPFGQDEDEEDP